MPNGCSMPNPNFKLSPELPFVLEKFQPNLDRIRAYAALLRQTGHFQHFETRLAWDSLRRYVGTETITGWYGKHNCTDKHITTLGIRALRHLGIL